MSLFSTLTSASNALSVFQNALTVTENNVSNASTAGYVDQVPTFEADSFVPGTGEAGGVSTGPLQSMRDDYADENVRTNTSQLGYYQEQVQTLTPLNNQFDITGNSGIPAALNQLFGAFSTWENTPNDASARQNVLTQAGNVATAFQTTSGNIAQIAQSDQQETSSLVDQVNQLAGQLASYNNQISSNGKDDPGTDAAVNSTIEKLSAIANVVMVDQPNGTFNVVLNGQTDLVDGSTVNKLTATVYIPTHSSVSSGAPIVVPVNITAGVNDTLNLKIDGASIPAIKLSPSDTSAAAVAADINSQLQSANVKASASINSNGNLVISSTSGAANASVQVLAGNANATLGLSISGPPNARITDSFGNDVTAQASAGGSLAAAIQQQNQVLPSIQGDFTQTGSLNQMAKSFADRVNSLLGMPLFTYDQTNATNVAASLQVNPNITANQLPAPQVTALTGSAPTFSITGSNNTLNLSVNGGSTQSITLSQSDTTLNSVVNDLNTQFNTLGIGAQASIDTATGGLTIATTNTSGSIQILSGTANATLGLTSPAATGTSGGNTTALTGSPMPLSINASNNTLSLSINGTTLAPIKLSSSDASLNDVVNDLNSKFKTLGVGAQASIDPGTGGLTIATTDTGLNGSIQILSSGTANPTLGLSNTTPSYQSQVTSLTGSAVTAGFSIGSTNNGLNLSVDGGAVQSIALSSSDASLNDVMNDLNSQFKTLGIGAQASINANTGGLTIATTNTGASGSIEILNGTSNATIGLSSPTASGPQNVALSLAALQNPTDAADEINGQSYTAFFGSIAANVGAQLSTAQTNQSSQQDIVTQAQTLRQQSSGVDLNEEATRVLELQSSYTAASKMISVVDNMVQTVLALIQPGSST